MGSRRTLALYAGNGGDGLSRHASWPWSLPCHWAFSAHETSSRNAVFRFFTRRLFDGLRGLDQLIWALVFVRAMGLGPIAGILAIAVAETGVLAKLFAEAIENIDRRPGRGHHVGRCRLVWQCCASPCLPQVMPVMISQTLYSIEFNSREATILGLVGAGGIGLRLSERIQINAWDQVAYIIVLILISVATIDTISRYLRLRLIGGTSR